MSDILDVEGLSVAQRAYLEKWVNQDRRSVKSAIVDFAAHTVAIATAMVQIQSTIEPSKIPPYISNLTTTFLWGYLSGWVLVATSVALCWGVIRGYWTGPNTVRVTRFMSHASRDN
jgi:hypothetical protein